jgi:cytochrome c oxidase assembly protein subunit 15
VALAVVAIQIALGGWVSSNYAALACQDFPTCQGAWLPAMDFDRAFTLHRELGQTVEGALLPFAALTAIHWTHRIGALVATVVVGSLALSLLTRPAWRRWGLALAGVLVLQVTLGIANVLLSLPLPVAVAHNLGAALLVAALVALNFRLRS